MSKIIVIIIKAYQKFISPLLKRNCRFYPTCSSYSIEAVKEYGTIIGSFYSIKRLLRCQPFSKGGLDPVPRRNQNP